MRALFIGSKVDEKWKIGLMHFDGDLNEIDGFGMWFEWFFQMGELTCKNGMIGGTLEKGRKKKIGPWHYIFWQFLDSLKKLIKT